MTENAKTIQHLMTNLARGGVTEQPATWTPTAGGKAMVVCRVVHIGEDAGDPVSVIVSDAKILLDKWQLHPHPDDAAKLLADYAKSVDDAMGPVVPAKPGKTVVVAIGIVAKTVQIESNLDDEILAEFTGVDLALLLEDIENAIGIDALRRMVNDIN